MKASQVLIVVFFVFSSVQVNAQEDLPVVENFDVAKYMGHWYLYSSIAQIVDFFCICSQTLYTVDPTNSSKINFDEYCRVGYTWAPYVHSHSYAEIDPVEKAKWTNVNTIIGSLTAKADYYIIDVEANYQWALVGSRDRKNLYILAREKNLTDEVYNVILKEATGLGFDASKVEKNNQECNDSGFLNF